MVVGCHGGVTSTFLKCRLPFCRSGLALLIRAEGVCYGDGFVPRGRAGVVVMKFGCLVEGGSGSGPGDSGMVLN